jgi:transposase
LVESGFQIVCIETRHAQRFLSSRPNKTDTAAMRAASLR